MAIKHICFDCDGTLYVSTPELIRNTDDLITKQLSEKLKIPQTDLMEDYLNRLKIHKTKTGTIVSYGMTEEQARDVINKFDIASFINPDPELVKMVHKLKSEDLTLSIFTNNKKATLESILRKIGLSSADFDFRVTAEQVPPKPSIEGYLYVVRESNYLASNILFVGDRLEADIEPARTVGMHTVQVRCPEKLINFDEKKGTYHFKRDDVYQVPFVVKIVDFLMTRR